MPMFRNGRQQESVARSVVVGACGKRNPCFAKFKMTAVRRCELLWPSLTEQRGSVQRWATAACDGRNEAP